MRANRHASRTAGPAKTGNSLPSILLVLLFFFEFAHELSASGTAPSTSPSAGFPRDMPDSPPRGHYDWGKVKSIAFGRHSLSTACS